MSRTVRTEVGEFLKKNGLDVACAVDGSDDMGKVKAFKGATVLGSFKKLVCVLRGASLAAGSSAVCHRTQMKSVAL